MQKKRTPQQGMTLLELMVVVAIVGILVAIAAPSFINFIDNNRVRTNRDALAHAIQLARSEAIQRALPVTICASADLDGVNCTNGNDWDNGWIVFVDINNNGSIEANEKVTPNLIEVNYGSGSLVIGAGSAIDAVTFNATGLRTLNGNLNNQFIGFCDPDKVVEGESLRISATGSISFSDASNAGCPT